MSDGPKDPVVLPVTLPGPCPEKTVGPNPLRSNYAAGWDAYEEKMRELGPLYPLAEIERLQRRVQNAELALKAQTHNRDTLRAQLAEAQVLLREAYEDGFRDGDLAKERGDHFGEAMKDGWLASDAYKALSASAEPSAPTPLPAYMEEVCDKFDWTPEEALRFYALGKHFDTDNGRTRILCTGAIASHALKGMSKEYADLKGAETQVEAHQGLQIDILTIARDALQRRLEALPEQLIAAIEEEQERHLKDDYLLDSKDCIRVIRKTMQKPLSASQKPTKAEFERWVLGTSHPVYGWLSKDFLEETAKGYDHPYVQALWLAVNQLN